MSVVVLSSPVTNPTVEYLDSPSATEVVFDESSADNLREENSTDNDLSDIGTTESPEESTQSDDIPATTTSPCGNDVESIDCNDPSENSIDPQSDEILNVSDNNKAEEKDSDSDPVVGTTAATPNSKEV